MSYTYNLSPAACFEDRYSQFIAFGIPKADVDTLRATIKDMWADAPGGWAYEWSAFARKYLEAGNPLLASFAYGFAIFPCLANDARRKAQQNQLECYLKAAPSFPVKFERRILAIPYQGGSVSTPVHLISVTGPVCERAGADLHRRRRYLQNGSAPGLRDIRPTPRHYDLGLRHCRHG